MFSRSKASRVVATFVAGCLTLAAASLAGAPKYVWRPSTKSSSKNQVPWSLGRIEVMTIARAPAPSSTQTWPPPPSKARFRIGSKGTPGGWKVQASAAPKQPVRATGEHRQLQILSEVVVVYQPPEEPSQPEEEPSQPEEEEPSQPEEEQPPPAAPAVQPPAAPAVQPPGAAAFGSSQALERLQARLDEIAPATPTQSVGSENLKILPQTDLAQAVQQSGSVSTVQTQRRAQIAFDPRVRGYHVGQLFTQADGAYWFPARQDLDTMLSKIDSSIIDNLIVIPGPYSARYGPGFSFLDIQTTATPRYQNGFEWYGRTSLNYQTNGQQWYGRQSFWGGSGDWGFRLGYGHRTGSDYESGGDVEIPSSYNARDIDSAFGIDLCPDSRIEFGYLRLDETGVEFPGQVFDVNEFLVTDGYTLRYVLENQYHFDRLTLDAWYNRTRFQGNAQNTGKRRQIPQLNSPPAGVLDFVGFTDVDQMSTGYRLATTWGDPDCPQLTLGADLRYMEMELNEFDFFDAAAISSGGLSNFPIPRSHTSNPGLFVENVLPICDRLVIKSGARLDWVSTDIEGATVDRDSEELHDFLQATNFDQHFALWAGYLTAECQLGCNWTASGGFGHAERPPTLTELYAVDPFLAMLQQGFTQVRGNPNLDPERLWQIDLGLEGEYSCFRSGITGFYAWVDDYITYQAHDDSLAVSGVEDGLGVKFVNTDLATLSGFELYAEYDWNACLTPFATMSYVEGRDHSRGSGFVDVDGDGSVDDDVVTTGSDEEPLPGIFPLQTRLGIRFHEPYEEPRWGIEMAVRVVDAQDRVASSLLERGTGGFTVWDLRGYWQATDGLLLVSGVENFTDKDYREHLDLRTGNGVFQPGINFYFGFEMNY